MMDNHTLRLSASRRALRIAVGGVSHETNTFSPLPTTLDSFRRRSLLSGEAILDQGRGSRSALGGVIAAADASGARLLPTLFASAPPGGLVTAETLEHLRASLLSRLQTLTRNPLGLDGVLLLLHGAMVAEGEDDVEGCLLREVRDLVGESVPIVAVLDSHANLTPAINEAADLLIVYQTYPHIDLVECGEEALIRLAELRVRDREPVSILRALPLLSPLPAQRTDGATTMAAVMASAREAAAQPGVVALHVVPGFPYSDVSFAGATITAATVDDRSLAERLAADLAQTLWDQRTALQPTGLAPDAAIDRVLAAPAGKPMVLADGADNPGAGAPGDGTHLLSRLIDRRVQGTVVGAITDPETVAAAFKAGPGATIRAKVGGKLDARGGPPLDLTCTVDALSDGIFTLTGPMGRGATARMGRAAALTVAGIEIVICEYPLQTLDPALFRAVGIEPAARQVVVVKSSVHFRAAFVALAHEMIEVEAGGLSSSDLTQFSYRRVRRPIVPLDREVRYLD
jgi:microcystin degradation protein MlrC